MAAFSLKRLCEIFCTLRNREELTATALEPVLQELKAMGIIIAQWQPDYESGNTLIDEQHKSLFSTINALNNALFEGWGETLLEQTIQSLKDYTSIHFDTEEAFMLAHHYPKYAEHRAKHEALKARVLQFEQNKQQDISTLTITISHFLADWLIQHIKHDDLSMIRFCCQHSSEGTTNLQPQAGYRESGMVLAPWRAEYETGYTLIDDQHRSLFHAINALHSAMLEGRADELIDRTLKSLKSYTTLHFETEEQFMLKYGYPGYSEHQAKHQVLREHVEQFRQQQRQQTMSKLTIEVSHFLTDWLIHHIKNEDQKMIAFLRQERQKEQALKFMQ